MTICSATNRSGVELKIRIMHQRQIFEFDRSPPDYGEQTQLKRLHYLAKRWQNSRRHGSGYMKDTFHDAIKGYICLGQVFGLMPLQNISASDPRRVRFRLKAKRFLWTFILFGCGTLKALQYIARLMSSGWDYKILLSLIFLLVNLIICVSLLNLASKWPGLIRHWSRVEMKLLKKPSLNNCGYYHHGWPLNKKMCTVSAICLLMAFVEYILHHISDYYNFHMFVTVCIPDGNATYHGFLREKYWYFFTLFPHNIVTTLLVMFVDWNIVFIWNFSDVFIMLVGLALAHRFHQLTVYIIALAERNDVAEWRWYALRCQHIALCELLIHVDDSLGNLIVMSVLSNTYFICNQLLSIFTKLRWPINYVYFWLSLIFLLARISSMFFCCATVREQALLPLKTFYLIPSVHWNEELERFVNQIITGNLCITGKQFFNVTRSSLFGLMAAIVTYELMLLQLEASRWKAGLPDLCANNATLSAANLGIHDTPTNTK